MEVTLSTSRDYSIVSIGGQIYSKHSYADGSLGYYRHEQTGGVSPLHSPADHAQIDAAIVELAHAEALDLKLFWHRTRIAADLMRKHGEESAVEACHAEALEIEMEMNMFDLIGACTDMIHGITGAYLKRVNAEISLLNKSTVMKTKEEVLSVLNRIYPETISAYIWSDNPQTAEEAIYRHTHLVSYVKKFLHMWDEAATINSAKGKREF